MKVAHFAPCLFAHVVDILLHPGEIIKRRLVVHGYDGDVARAVLRRFRVHAENDLFVRCADQSFINIRKRGNGHAIDRQDVIPGLEIDADGGERRAGVLVPVLAR